MIYWAVMDRILPHFHTFLILAVLSLLLLVADSAKLLHLPKNAGYFVTNPLSFSLYTSKQRVSKQLYFIFAARRAAQQNRALEDQIGQLLSENADLRVRLSETEAQLAQEQTLDPRTYRMAAARPIGRGRFLRIDKGEKDGVKIGQAVIFKDSLIGRVNNTTPSGADVQLLTDPNWRISAFSMNREGRAKGILIGQFGTETLFDKILHEEKIEEGDLVYSDGTEEFLPRGLILGRVSEVLVKENEIFKQAKVVPIFDVRDLDLVFVILE